MSRMISVIPGDGIGPEIMSATLRVLDALDAGLEYEMVEAGLVALEKEGDLIPESTLESISRNRVVLKGPLTTPVGKGFRSINVTLRKHFDLYANVRPVISMAGTKSHFENMGLTNEKFNELKDSQGNCSNLVQCSDPNSEFNDGNNCCVDMDCYCLCKSGYESDSSGNCIQSSSSNSSTNNFWTPKKVMVGVGIGIGVMVMFSLMSGGEKDVLEESV